MIWTGAVDQRIDAVPFFIHVLDPFDRGFRIRDVALKCQAAGAARFHGIDNRARFLGAGAVTDRDRPAPRGQIQRHGAANSPRAAADQSDSIIHG